MKALMDWCGGMAGVTTLVVLFGSASILSQIL